MIIENIFWNQRLREEKYSLNAALHSCKLSETENGGNKNIYNESIKYLIILYLYREINMGCVLDRIRRLQ